MTKEELKNKCTKRAKIFQQAMKNCKSSNPMELIEWFADRIVDLEKENVELKETLKTYNGCGDWDNDFHTCRVYLQHEELQMYVEQLNKAKDLIDKLLHCGFILPCYKKDAIIVEAEQFLGE